MYSNMGHLQIFKENVVKDGRSYSNETFEKAAKILNSTKKHINVTDETKEKFEALAAELNVMKNIAAEEEVSL